MAVNLIIVLLLILIGLYFLYQLLCQFTKAELLFEKYKISLLKQQKPNVLIELGGVFLVALFALQQNEIIKQQNEISKLQTEIIKQQNKTEENWREEDVLRAVRNDEVDFEQLCESIYDLIERFKIDTKTATLMDVGNKLVEGKKNRYLNSNPKMDKRWGIMLNYFYEDGRDVRLAGSPPVKENIDPDRLSMAHRLLNDIDKMTREVQFELRANRTTFVDKKWYRVPRGHVSW